MNLTDALAVIEAYKDQGRLTGPRRRLLAIARKIVWDHAEMLATRENE